MCDSDLCAIPRIHPLTDF